MVFSHPQTARVSSRASAFPSFPPSCESPPVYSSVVDVKQAIVLSTPSSSSSSSGLSLLTVSPEETIEISQTLVRSRSADLLTRRLFKIPTPLALVDTRTRARHGTWRPPETPWSSPATFGCWKSWNEGRRPKISSGRYPTASPTSVRLARVHAFASKDDRVAIRPRVPSALVTARSTPLTSRRLRPDRQ